MRIHKSIFLQFADGVQLIGPAVFASGFQATGIAVSFRERMALSVAGTRNTRMPQKSWYAPNFIHPGISL